MKINEKPFGNPNAKGDITGVFEILIPNELWEKITTAQRKHVKFTFSWITRYSLSRLVGRNKFWARAKFADLLREDKRSSKRRNVCHRHLICLYGDDYKRLKIFSAEIGISISALVRIALMWQLYEFDVQTIPDAVQTESERDRLAKISFEKIKMYGTKFVKNLQITRLEENYFSPQTVLDSSPFELADFW